MAAYLLINGVTNKAMNKLIFTLAVLAFSAVFTAAQTDDYKKGEFYVGYSNGQVDGSTYRFTESTTNFRDTGASNFNGIGVAGVYNFHRYIGVKGDVSATFNGGDVNIPINLNTRVTGDTRNSLYNFLGGVQFKDNSTDRRIKPFAHLLVGAGHARTRADLTCSPSTNCGGVIISETEDETGFAGAFGGGLDIRINDRFDLRAGQIDYNPIKLDSGTLHNFRFGIGIVIK